MSEQSVSKWILSGGFAEDVWKVIRENAYCRDMFREIVREEIENQKLVAMTEKAQRDCYDQTKPKTDLERVRDLCWRFERTIKDSDGTPEWVRGYRAACNQIELHVSEMRPSPDWEAQATRWRKIAEGLRWVGPHTEYACTGPGPSGCPRCAAVWAYDAAVKGAQ